MERLFLLTQGNDAVQACTSEPVLIQLQSVPTNNSSSMITMNTTS